MARSALIALLTLAGMLAASPAAAQFPNIFDSIFGNPQQRPPADVPRPPGSVPSEPQYYPPPGGLPPGPPPRSRPYSGGPRGGVQTQPLPPPPGASSAPATARGFPPDTRQQDASPLPGLPPGQRQPRGAPQPAATPPVNEEVVVEPPPHKIANPTAVFSGLDKITGRIISFDVAINETVRFGALEVTPRACYTRPPTETPNTDGFIEVDELTLQGELRRIFDGWMFAASPGLNAVEHPIYDVWLTDCKGGTPTVTAESPPEPAAPPKRAPPPRAQPRRATQQLPPPPSAAR
jgi:hypothetical protein